MTELAEAHRQGIAKLFSVRTSKVIQERERARRVARPDAIGGELEGRFFVQAVSFEQALQDSGRGIEVSFRNGGANATVTVRDEGTGIPAELQAHLFEAGRTGRRNGTGLGLAISQLLARQINAKLELDSTGPAGTTFRLAINPGDKLAFITPAGTGTAYITPEQ